MFDFIAVLAGVLVIIGCVILLTALVRWVIADVPVTFRTLWEIFMQAVVVPEA